MDNIDPVILIPIFSFGIFLCGYGCAWCQARALIRRYERSYGSLISRSR